MAQQIRKQGFDLSAGKKRPRVEERSYLDWVRRRPCLITGKREGIHAAHVRYGSLPHGKRETGAGEKPSDVWVVPLHEDQHVFGRDAQHGSGERRWWRAKGIDPLCVAALLYLAFLSDDDAAGDAICAGARELAMWAGNAR